MHEAAHAVAAIQRDIDFEDVAIYSPHEWLETSDGVVAGGVTVGDSLERMARDEPRRTLEFALAGVQGERVVLGHELASSYIGDLNIWRRAVRITEGNQMPAIEALLGGTVVEVAVEVESWVRENRQAILRVAGDLERKSRLTRGQVTSLMRC